MKIEGLALALSHLIGEAGEGQNAAGDDQQGQKRGDFRAGDRQGAYQKGA